MQASADEHRFFFVDETGDPNFYGKGKKLIVGNEGCSRTFGLGFLRTTDPEAIRSRLLELRHEVASSRYLQAIPSHARTLASFHAKNDCPEVRHLVFEALDSLNFSVQIIVARKLQAIFISKHKESTESFYNDLTSKLFQTQLHLATRNTIVFARRGDKEKQHTLRAAVEAGVVAFRTKYPRANATTVDVATAFSREDPALQAADYALWAVQRAFERGEMRYFDFIREKFELVWDMYDFLRISRKEVVMYSRRYPFRLEYVSPLS